MFNKNKALIIFLCYAYIYCNTNAQSSSCLEQFKKAYPDHIQAISEQYILWADGTLMRIGNESSNASTLEKLNNPSLADQIEQPNYISGVPSDLSLYHPMDDPGRIRYEPFFRKMYGNSPTEVESNLIEIDWMPEIFGKGVYTLPVTTINDIHKKLHQISNELTELVIRNPQFCIFLNNPGGTYCWRMIANTHRLSNHSFGMTIDINPEQSQYWQWDLQNEGRHIDEEAQLTYRNHIPWEIILIFEKYGFIWGGKWSHYDTMHFEYRPELFST